MGNIIKTNLKKYQSIFFGLFLLIFFGSLLCQIVLFNNKIVQEFNAHISFAIRMQDTGHILVPHFLFQYLTILTHEILNLINIPTYKIISTNGTLPFDWAFSGLIVTLVAQIATVYILSVHLKYRFLKLGNNNTFLAYVISFALCIITPIFILAPLDNLFYLGYITPSTIYIIPTQILLKLPSLALFLMTANLFQSSSVSKKTVFYIILLSILSGLAKPNFILIMIPALFIMLFISKILNLSVSRKGIFVAIISSVLVLAWQYYFKFINTESLIYKSDVIFTTPFEVMIYYSNYIFVKILLSVAFPLFVTCAFWRIAKQDRMLCYGWVLFLIGLLFTAFLAETGDAHYAGNFFWSGQIGCFMLFVSAASMFFSKCINLEYKKPYRYLAYFIFLLHVACGIIYYFRSYTFSYV